MKMMKKRGLALVLALVLALSLLPISAFATEGEAAPTATPTYKVGETYTFDTKEPGKLPTNIPADAMWEFVGEVEHTHTADCYNKLIVLKDGDIGTFTDSENVSQAHMWKAAGGEWYALDCVPANTDDTDDTDDDHDNTDDTEQPAFTSGEVHHVGSYDGHAAGCYGRRVVPLGDDLPGTIDGEEAIYTFKTTTVANWYAANCDSAPQYSWKLVEFVINQKLIKISYAWAGTADAIAAVEAVEGVELPDNDVKEIVINQAAVKPVPTATIDGYEISGWYTEEACMNKYISYTQLEGKSAITLYAKVAAVVADPEVPVKTHTYTVKYRCMSKDGMRLGTNTREYTATSAPTIEGIWDALTEPELNNKNFYSKRDKAMISEDIQFVKKTSEEYYNFKLYLTEQAPSTKLTIRMEVNGLGDDKSAYEKLIGDEADSLLYELTHSDGVITRLKEFRYGTGEQPYSTGLTTITHTLMQYNADVPGYTLTTTCNDLDNDPKNGYQFNVVAGENTVVTITNTYEKIPEKVYSLIFDAGDNGVMQVAEANEIAETTYRWQSDVEDPYWEKVGGAAVSSKKLIYQFTEENVAAEIALFAGKGSVATSPKTPGITANEGYAFRAFQLTDGTQYSMENALWDALVRMSDSEATSLTYHATYTGGSVNPPVDPNPPVNPPVDPNPPVETPVLPGGDDGYEPAIPPVTPLPDPEVPLAPLPDELVTDLPQEEIPLAELPEDEVPLAELPEEEVPLAEAPKTGDSFGIWVALLGMSSLAMAALVLGKRKENQEN